MNSPAIGHQPGRTRRKPHRSIRANPCPPRTRSIRNQFPRDPQSQRPRSHTVKSAPIKCETQPLLALFEPHFAPHVTHKPHESNNINVQGRTPLPPGEDTFPKTSSFLRFFVASKRPKASPELTQAQVASSNRPAPNLPPNLLKSSSPRSTAPFTRMLEYRSQNWRSIFLGDNEALNPFP